MSWRPRWRRPPGGVRGSATKVPTHQSNTGQQAQRSCVSAGRCAHRGANRWAIKKTFHTAKRETGLEHYQARHGYQQLRYGRDRCQPTATAPKDAFRKKSRRLVSVMVMPFPRIFGDSVEAANKEPRCVPPQGVSSPETVHHRSPITDHPALSNDHLHCSIEAIITEVTTTGRLLR